MTMALTALTACPQSGILDLSGFVDQGVEQAILSAAAIW
jgi:hypothetical protein